MKKRIVGAIILLLIGAGGGIGYYIYRSFHCVTSNAVFIKSDSLKFLGFKRPGRIERIYISEGAPIQKGDLIAQLEQEELKRQIEGIEARRRGIREGLTSLKLQQMELKQELELKKRLISARIEELKGEIGASERELTQLKRDYDRFKHLYHQGKIALQKLEQVETKYQVLSYRLKGLRSKLKGLKIELDIVKVKGLEVERLERAIGVKKAQLEEIGKRLQVLKLHLKDGYLYSPIDGVVAKKFKREGEIVSAGEQVVAVVNPRKIYALVLLEETKLKGIGIGSRATVHIDSLDRDFPGKVVQILPVSAATFALVPRDFSSGEFTKLSQRFYVKIGFTAPTPGVLVGMGGEVTIFKK